MNLIIVADSVESMQPILAIAAQDGHQVLKLSGADEKPADYVDRLRPDALIYVSDEIGRGVLSELSKITDTCPTPILIFTQDSDDRSINAAVKAGASAYVVGCNEPRRLGALLGVAKARFEEREKLTKELVQTKQALNERKIIERAKGIVMKRKSLSEEQAYGAMRKLAMNQNKRIGEIAEQIVSAAEVLV